jgi:hypothetical protein
MRSSEGTDEEALRPYGNKFCEIPPRGRDLPPNPLPLQPISGKSVGIAVIGNICLYHCGNLKFSDSCREAHS